ncbi:MAG: hypothetical protein IIX93_14310, partial [Clostridia bacterium]|nr:hypothetical protein [Clostridia bacterium]
MNDYNKNAFLFEPLKELKVYNDLLSALENKACQYAYGADDSQRVHILSSLARDTKRPFIVVCPNDTAGAHIVDDFNALTGGGAQMLPAREVSFLHAAASSKELSLRRLEAIGKFVSGEVKLLVVPADALMHRLMQKTRFMANVINVSEGECMEPMELIEKLVRAGYERVDIVDAKGQCALRGGILDVYPVGSQNAVRIEFFDDEVDSLRDFDVLTQRSVSRLKSVTMYPASEILIYGNEARKAADKIESMLVLKKPEETEDRQRQIEKEFDLIPFEEFFEITAGDGPLEELPSMFELGKKPKKPKKSEVKKNLIPRSTLQKKYSPIVEALKADRLVDGREALIHILYEKCDTILDYQENPIIVLDQPDRLRDRCENRMLEFEEYFKAAMERDEAFKDQAELLLTFDQLLPEFDKHSALILQPFLRQQSDFKVKNLFKFE